MDALIENAVDGTVLVLIPEGEFIANGGRVVSKTTQFSIRLPAFYLALHCVTNAQYAQFLNALQPEVQVQQEWIDLTGGCYVRQIDEAYEADEKKWNDPVVQVSWYGAEAYCAWAGLRLPSELEWEKGARGIDGRDFPWGDSWDASRCLNGADTPETATNCVWGYAQGTSPWGAYQMAGNVWEWCRTPYEENAHERYMCGDVSDSARSNTKTLRGGAGCFVNTGAFRCSSRFSFTPNRQYDICGFRCARCP